MSHQRKCYIFLEWSARIYIPYNRQRTIRNGRIYYSNYTPPSSRIPGRCICYRRSRRVRLPSRLGGLVLVLVLKRRCIFLVWSGILCIRCSHRQKSRNGRICYNNCNPSKMGIPGRSIYFRRSRPETWSSLTEGLGPLWCCLGVAPHYTSLVWSEILCIRYSHPHSIHIFHTYYSTNNPVN